MRTIHGFQQLQELELAIICPKDFHEALISSITSPELQKIIFRVGHTLNPIAPPVGLDGWTSMDEHLCGFVDRLRRAGHRHTLNVELRFWESTGDPGHLGFTTVLPKFKEKGVVTIIEVDRGGRVFYSSAHGG